CGSETIVDMYW
nr:immunoglobulin heavy chain junction region [Macaca mulatta]MOW20085.1 immunoglobulin heavy chain junction region [Macaca mulatta]MOW20855.1 immunoglobulin heavy chain junction region [Macaca mulatta]MOW21091.1 immunoglobulin heavy chain junction region [Macaca mulatta]MOW21515.1 immunoglobulin heavy chain junction region [Macaca mulatta]